MFDGALKLSVSLSITAESQRNPENIRLDEDVLKTSFVCVFRRRLHQDEYIRLTHTSSEDVLIKTNILVLVIRLQDVFKTFSRRLQDVLQKRFQDIFKTSCKDVFKTYHQIKLFLLTHLQDVFNTFLRRTAKMVIYRRIYQGHTSEKFMVSVQSLQE